MEIKADAKERKAEMKELKKDMNTLKTELISAFTQSQKDFTSATEKQLAAYALDQQKQFSNLYFRGFFTVSLTLYVIY